MGELKPSQIEEIIYTIKERTRSSLRDVHMSFLIFETRPDLDYCCCYFNQICIFHF